MWQCMNHDRTIFFFIHGAHANAAVAGVINFVQIFCRTDDFRFCRVVGSWYMLHQVFDSSLGFFKQVHAGVNQFTQIMGRYIGGHAHCDAGGTVEQYIG